MPPGRLAARWSLVLGLITLPSSAQEPEFEGSRRHRLLPPTAVATGRFGLEVAARDDTAFVSASGHGASGSEARVFLYRRDEGGPDNWGSSQVLAPSAPGAVPASQLALRVHEDWLVVGASNESWTTPAGTSATGAVHVYQRQPDGSYAHRQRLVSPAPGPYQFGYDVDTDGSFVVVGSRNASVDGEFRGAVHVWERTTSATTPWAYLQTLTGAPLRSPGFGDGVAISGETLAVGHLRDGDGKVYLFERDRDSGRFVEVQRLVPAEPCPAPRCVFGFRFDLHKTELFIGHLGPPLPGVVYHYRGVGGAWSWVESRRPAASGDLLYGQTVRMAPTLVIVGAHRENDDGGAAYLHYQHHPERGIGWGQVARLESDAPRVATRFGQSVAVDRRLAVVGAPLDSREPVGQGSAYVFDLSFSHAPRFDSTPLREAQVGETYEHEILASDADGDALTLTARALPAWLTSTPGASGAGTLSATLSGTPTGSDTGPHDVELTVSDGTRSTTQSFRIMVRAAAPLPFGLSRRFFLLTALALVLLLAGVAVVRRRLA
ncbi:MAG: putative Ig domain-containing protein [Acidobacteriota bacterium]